MIHTIFVKSGQVTSGQVKPVQVNSGHVKSGQVKSGQTNLASDSQMEDGHQCECELEATQCGIEVRENRADDEWRIGGRMI